MFSLFSSNWGANIFVVLKSFQSLQAGRAGRNSTCAGFWKLPSPEGKTRAGLAVKELSQELWEWRSLRLIPHAFSRIQNLFTQNLFIPSLQAPPPTPSVLLSTRILLPFSLLIPEPQSSSNFPNIYSNSPEYMLYGFYNWSNGSKPMGAQITIKFFLVYYNTCQQLPTDVAGLLLLG